MDAIQALLEKRSAAAVPTAVATTATMATAAAACHAIARGKPASRVDVRRLTGWQLPRGRSDARPDVAAIPLAEDALDRSRHLPQQHVLAARGGVRKCG